MFLSNIDLSHPGANKGASRGRWHCGALIPGVVDKTMEETFLMFSRSDGGLVGLFSMFGAYQRWCRMTSACAQYFLRCVDSSMTLSVQRQGSIANSRLLRSRRVTEEAVQRTLTAIKTFNDPFAITGKDRLYNITSGAPVSPEVEIDVLRADTAGKGFHQ